MAKLQEVGDLQIDQDLLFQQRSWRVQRIAWWMIVLLLLAGLLGIFGSGPVSMVSIAVGNGRLRLNYERFLRFSTLSELALQVRPDAKHPTKVRVWLNRDYVDGFQTQQITPPPAYTQVTADRIIFIFEVAESTQPIEISFQLTAMQTGFVSGAIGLEEGSRVHFWHFIYP